MQVLTPSGYVDIIDLNIGDEVVAYDINTGAQIINHVEGKTLWSPDMYPPDVIEGHYDQDGVWIPTEVLRTSYEVFQSVHGDWKYYRINGTWDLFKFQSVWVNMNIVHAPDLQVGDIVYNDQDGDVLITSIEEVDTPLTWWKLDVSGDSSYIADDITLHNASRYWVGGGSSSNWNATGNTNWGSSSGGANNASVPTSADVAIFDGAGALGNTNSTISAIITVGGYSVTSAYTATINHNFDLTVAGSITLGANYTIAGTAALRISAACTFTSNGKTWPNSLIFTTTTITTLVGNLTINGLWEALNAISPTINITTTETLTCGGGIFFGNNCIPTGTATHIITGGTLNTNAGYGGFNLPLDIAGNVTLLRFAVQSKTVNYISGVVTTTGSTFYIGGGSTLNLSGISFNNVDKGGPTTVGGTTTLTSNMVVNGLLSGAGDINKTTSETITCNGGILAGNNSLKGTVELIAKGGTITTTSYTYSIDSDLTIDGNVTFAGNVLYHSGEYGTGRTLKYLSGTTNAASTTLYIKRTSSIDTSAISWAAVVRSMNNDNITTLISNLNVIGATSTLSSGPINTSTSAKLITGGLIINAAQSGTAVVELIGGTWSGNFILSNPFIFNGNSTISGTVQYGGSLITYTSGTINSTSASLTFTNSTQTLALNGANINCPMTFAGGTKTLSTNFNTNGLVTISAATTVNRTTTETFSCGGGIAVNNTLAGTADVYLTGGTWSGTNTNGISNNLFIDGNITLSGIVYYRTGTLKYNSGTVTQTGSILKFSGNSTLHSNGLTWNSIDYNNMGGVTVTLITDLNISGTFIPTGFASITFNKTTNESVNMLNGINSSGGAMIGTATFNLRGGTWSGTGNLSCVLNLIGDITISGSVGILGGGINYVSGNINTADSTLRIANHATNTLNTAGIIWDNVTTPGNAASTTFVSDFVARNIVLSSNSHAFNTSTGARIIPLVSLTLANTFPWGGNATLLLGSGVTFNCTNSNISSLGLTIDGNCTLIGTLNIGSTATTGNNTITYVSGNVTYNNFILNITGNTALRGMNKIPVPKINVTAASILSMDQFFTGTPSNPCAIACSTAASTYSVVFPDTFERIATNVITSGCVLSRPMQLILSSPSRINTIRTTNSGVRYVNQSPNGVAKNAPTKTGMFIGVPGGLQSDPCFTKQN
jgi:fibronectin-binding autotransporter adhesin